MSARANYSFHNLPRAPEVTEKQFPMLIKSAEDGVAKAQYIVGVCYASGQCVERDVGSAFDWFSRAAEQGVVEAAAVLGQMYVNGSGVQQDLSAGITWIYRSAIKGLSCAQCSLFEFYYSRGEIEKSYVWLKYAAITEGGSKLQGMLQNLRSRPSFCEDTANAYAGALEEASGSRLLSWVAPSTSRPH